MVVPSNANDIDAAAATPASLASRQEATLANSGEDMGCIRSLRGRHLESATAIQAALQPSTASDTVEPRPEAYRARRRSGFDRSKRAKKAATKPFSQLQREENERNTKLMQAALRSSTPSDIVEPRAEAYRARRGDRFDRKERARKFTSKSFAQLQREQLDRDRQLMQSMLRPKTSSTSQNQAPIDRSSTHSQHDWHNPTQREHDERVDLDMNVAVRSNTASSNQVGSEVEDVPHQAGFCAPSVSIQGSVIDNGDDHIYDQDDIGVDTIDAQIHATTSGDTLSLKCNGGGRQILESSPAGSVTSTRSEEPSSLSNKHNTYVATTPSCGTENATTIPGLFRSQDHHGSRTVGTNPAQLEQVHSRNEVSTKHTLSRGTRSCDEQNHNSSSSDSGLNNVFPTPSHEQHESSTNIDIASLGRLDKHPKLVWKNLSSDEKLERARKRFESDNNKTICAPPSLKRRRSVSGDDDSRPSAAKRPKTGIQEVRNIKKQELECSRLEFGISYHIDS